MKKSRTIIWIMIVLVSFVLLIPKNSLEVNACEGQTQNNLSNYVYSAPISPLIPTKSIVGQSRNFTNSPMLARSLKPGDEESTETIYAPDGTSITAYHYYDYEDDEVRKAAQRFVEEDLEFTELEVEELPTWRYNCHAYAWYNDRVWIDFAEPFVYDDYTSHFILLQDVQIGDIVTYWEVTYNDNNEIESFDLCLHSAVVEGIKADGTIVCKSKWAQWGLYIHDIDYVPIDYYNIEYTNTTKTYDLCCFFLRQNDHLISYNTINNNRHYIECSVDGCSYYNILHDTIITSVNSNRHRLSCAECDYSVYESHELYLHTAEPGDYVVKCRDCSYTLECSEDPEFIDGNEGHWVDCTCGCYSFFEEHSYNYLPLLPSNSNRLYYHQATCSVCTGTHYLAHNWVTVWGGSVECTDCGLESEFGGVENIMSLSDEELSLLLSSMSAEELEQFIASLPEAAISRVTAILPPDDDELVTE